MRRLKTKAGGANCRHAQKPHLLRTTHKSLIQHQRGAACKDQGYRVPDATA